MNYFTERKHIISQRKDEINTFIRTKIVSGFQSAALDPAGIIQYTYDSEEYDQINLIGAKSIGIDISYKCTDPDGIKMFRSHTSAQIQQVLVDGAVHKAGLIAKGDLLKDELQSLTDTALLNYITEERFNALP